MTNLITYKTPFQKLLALAPIWGTESLAANHCYECWDSGNYPVLTISDDGVAICPNCGKIDARFCSAVRGIVSLLEAVGFKVYDASVSTVRDVGSDRVMWSIKYLLTKRYNRRIFDELPRELFYFESGDMSGIEYLHSHPVADIFVLDEIALTHGEPVTSQVFEAQHTAKKVELMKNIEDLLNQWYKDVDENGNRHVWKLAGYFD